MNKHPIVRVIFADDNASTRAGMALVFETMKDMQLVGLAENGAIALELCEQNHPDIVLMDLKMPEMDGVSATRLIKSRFPNIQVVVMTGFDDKSLSCQAAQAGAKVFLSKDATIDEMILVLRSVIITRIDCPRD
jgi:DNA-binding NarL/FixJ family response regulator